LTVDGRFGGGVLDCGWDVWSAPDTELGPAEEGRMTDPNSMLATLAIAIAVFASATLVLSRIIPDEYDRRAPVRRNSSTGRRRR
jgi:hypothetical protein